MGAFPSHSAFAGDLNAAGASAALPATPAPTGDGAASATDTLGEIVVTGTRAINQTARQSQSPITVISSAVLQQAGTPNLASSITRVYPEINMQSEPANGDALTSSIEMRGLNPNHVLVLVDGIRRHSSANIDTAGGITFGSTPVDLNMIPGSAIDHVEVLEDGASALYGSDAIAGVINIITKKATSGFNVSETTGGNAVNGDGFSTQLDADGGVALGSDGYVHLSGQVMHRDLSVIKVIDHRFIENQAPAGALTSIGYTGTTPVSPYVNQVSNIPEETREDLALTFGKPLSSGVDGYGSVTYAHRDSQSPQQFRLPTIAPQVYPNGFSPIDANDENDFAATLGLRGADLLGFNWNVASTYGEDLVRLSAKNNINLGILGANCVSSLVNPTSIYASAEGCGYAKTNFFLKGFTSAQWDNKLDLRRDVTLPFNIPMNLAFGGEHRLETYTLTAGEPAAYQVGGTQAIAGLTPENAGSWNRTILAGYIDGDFKFTRKWSVDVAGRYEHYSDFGGTDNGKISTRYDFSRQFAIRGTISNGFRAPTLAEQHYSSATETPTSAGGLLPANSDAARLLGATPLKPEQSKNYSVGAVLEPIRGLDMEIDAYQIDIHDRIVSSSSIAGQPAINALADFGFIVPSAVAVNNVTANYLTNGADTRTQGLDIKGSYKFELGDYGKLTLSAAEALNQTTITHLATGSNGKPLLNAQAISYFTTEYPRSKLLLDGNWTWGKFGVNLRESRYGQTVGELTYQDWATGTCSNGSLQRYSTTCFGKFVSEPRWMTDVQINYDITAHLRLAVGANNLFSVRPSELPPNLQYNGVYLYDQYSAGIPMTGGFYYGRISVNF